MAMQVTPMMIGVDVSKASLELVTGAEAPVTSVANEPKAITAWLRTLPKGQPVALAVEATNTYHLALAMQAHQAGHTVYLINGFRLNRYRDSVGQRAKTDASDARLLHRYLSRESDQLRPWHPPCKAYTRIQRLLNRRAKLVQACTTLRQSLAGLQELRTSVRAAIKHLVHLQQLIEARIHQAIAEAGWQTQQRRCGAIEGVGPISSAALCWVFQRGQFSSADAFVAFLGLDIRTRDSGTFIGRGKLTKQGDPELRRLLYLAAMSASRKGRWAEYYQRLLARGMAKTQAFVALARKLAKVAFSLMHNQRDYDPDFTKNACLET